MFQNMLGTFDERVRLVLGSVMNIPSCISIFAGAVSLKSLIIIDTNAYNKTIIYIFM